MAGASLRSEFTWKKLGVGDVHPGRFVYSQWRLPSLLYIFYRLSLAAYTDYWIIKTGITMENMRMNLTNENGSKQMFTEYSFPVYLTNWTYFMLCLYLTLHALFIVIHFCLKFRTNNCLSSPHAEGHRALFNELSSTPSFWDEDRSSNNEDGDPITTLYSLPWYFKLTYILYSIAAGASILVTIAFFAFIWPFIDESEIDMINLQLHGINSVIVFVDLLIHAIPVRLLHALYVLVYGLIYVIFSVIFYAAGNHKAIYPKVLDWSQPGITVGLVLALMIIAVPIIYVFLFVVHKLKLIIYHKVTPWSTL